MAFSVVAEKIFAYVYLCRHTDLRISANKKPVITINYQNSYERIRFLTENNYRTNPHFINLPFSNYLEISTLFEYVGWW